MNQYDMTVYLMAVDLREKNRQKFREQRMIEEGHEFVKFDFCNTKKVEIIDDL